MLLLLDDDGDDDWVAEDGFLGGVFLEEVPAACC